MCQDCYTVFKSGSPTVPKKGLCRERESQLEDLSHSCLKVSLFLLGYCSLLGLFGGFMVGVRD